MFTVRVPDRVPHKHGLSVTLELGTHLAGWFSLDTNHDYRNISYSLLQL